ncbi:hypothetical protein [Mesorhizobium sp.]|uniref:hypothetical protein n=1 Tax=Mesorhizobium sp. TaxID=1871066 RepID=UPI000FE653B4|nr:hypothetical protein [Mesorhizobium sp.]RWE37447.1 MAG: hypothetical protein EOS77_02385 [Mesorhizobium sp.]
MLAREGRRCARNGVPEAATAWLDALLEMRGHGIARRLPTLQRLLEDAIRDISEMLGIPVDAQQTEVR